MYIQNIKMHSLPGGSCTEEMLHKYAFSPLKYEPIDPEKVALDAKFFNFICKYPKFTLMKNKKRRDPIIEEVQMAQDFVMNTEYGLPKPNLKASYISLNKYGKVQPIVDERAATFAYCCMCKHFGVYMSDSKVLTKEDAMREMDKTTSPGFPWNEIGSTKNEILEAIPEQFHEFVDKVWDHYLLQDDYWFIFVNSLKEEIRPTEKIKLNKIRTFTASPMEAVVVGYRLFGDMNNKFYDSHLKTASVVGLCPFRGGWDSLYQKLKNHPKTKNPIAYELDESEYDSSLFQQIFDCIVRFRWNCLRDQDKTPENYKRVCNYYKNLVNSVIITADGNIVQKSTGNPSGSVNTISDNTLALYWLLAYAWYLLASEELRTYEDFDESVILALQGDDNTWTVDEITNLFYNAKTVSAIFSSVGVTTTSPSYEPRRLEEVEFLSSSFSKKIAGMCIYDLCPEKLVESLKWTKHPGDATMTLVRVLAIMRVTWPDREMRKLCKTIANYIIEKYDPILMFDSEWKLAKAQYLPDEEYRMFYCGGKSTSPIKINMPTLEIEEISEQVVNMHGKKKKAKAIAKKKEKKVKQAQSRNQRKVAKVPKRSMRVFDAPIAKGYLEKMSKPRVGRRMAVVVSHREFIQNVEGTSAFTVQSFAMNPGLVNTFPWLSQVAPLFEQYKFESLKFDYQAAQSSTKIGTVMMTTDYDAADLPPLDKRQAMNFMGATRGQPWFSFSHVCDKGAMAAYKKRFVRTTTLPANQDVKTFDSGVTYLCTEGQDNTDRIGELYVDYSVRFWTPALNVANSLIGGRVIGGGTLTAANLLGDAATLDGSAQGISVSTAGVITFGANAYVNLTLSTSGTSITSTTTLPGWTVSFNTLQSTIQNSRQWVKYVSRGETVGPFENLGSTPASCTVWISVAPYQSLTLSQQQALQEEEEFQCLKSEIARLNAIVHHLAEKQQEVEEQREQRFVVLPRLSSVDRVSGKGT